MPCVWCTPNRPPRTTLSKKHCSVLPPLLSLPSSLSLSLFLLSLHSLVPLSPPSRFEPSIHDWEAWACLTLEQLIMRQSYERADRWMAREWFRRRTTGRQIEGFWRVSAVSRVALSREEVSFFVGSSGTKWALQAKADVKDLFYVVNVVDDKRFD